ncbi:DNA polymerase III subunit gamma/tau [Microbulbifer thermotolerans]|uniref:DNA polymerase III subunit gamma/tau n=1 Tax=Microbulbifer thermotolerans TaxID=252514 RepID=UPI0008EBA717|nr:DNA polymerase III subunit gamma/tau [Microbulbifer thermotolerans]MCX2831990.1 DNA polymerase III subunit gamma/tau [Microbulbifer thermotolerans]SFC59952.1 DNA polymerase-3 subunit gamma/tau [Microbulbifer thermotolerans]
MSYQVLARKWRPRLFREMVGQEHVLQALINALDNGRLHHAYLFAGTRGVGKTTIARILAKCLNCESGVSSEPCGQCLACTEIAEGRFVDLIEVDAASRTKVEDTRELLENVQYAPTKGRYKVYLIDEVHMLSNSSFNALLKTLEEPPPHVKFLLATTDPQKLPVTVLSRCLQFNLKNMSPERVVEHLRFVLEQEMVPFEEGALWLLGRAADGSMRDAMSLTDQAIAFGGGKISESEVRAMLGSIDTGLVWKLLQALAEESAPALFAAVEELAQQAPDYSAALAELANNLHRIAVAQVLPQSADNALGDGERLRDLAGRLAPENVQLYYQMALLARRDLPLAPDPRSGFEMALLRMLAFRPQGVADVPRARLQADSGGEVAARESAAQEMNSTRAESPEGKRPQPDLTPAEPTAEPIPSPALAPAPVAPLEQAPASASGPAEPPQPTGSQPPAPGSDDRPADPVHTAPEPEPPAQAAGDKAALREQLRRQVAEVEAGPAPAPEASQPDKSTPSAEKPKARLDALTPGSWPALYSQLGVSGILHSIAFHLELVGRRDNILSFILDESYSSLYDEVHQRRLADLLGDFFQQPVTVHIQVGQVQGQTPAHLAAATREERLAAAREALSSDPLVRELQQELGAELLPDSVESLVETE